MRKEDLYVAVQPSNEYGRQTTIDEDLLSKLGSGPIEEFTDFEVAETLLWIIRDELVERGTSKRNNIDDAEFRSLVRAAKSVSARLGFKFPSLPFRDLSGFEDYWKIHDMSGSWDKCRVFVRQHFHDFDRQLMEYFDEIPNTKIFDPMQISIDGAWEAINTEIEELRNRFSSSKTEADFNSVGLSCIRIIELTVDYLFDESKYVIEGERPPSADQSINRLDRIVETELIGSRSAKVRKSVRCTVELAHHVKHCRHPTRLDAVIAADATLALVNILRNITNPNIY